MTVSGEEMTPAERAADEIKTARERQISMQTANPEYKSHRLKTPPTNKPITKDYVGPSRQSPLLRAKTGEKGGAEKAAFDVPERPLTPDQAEKFSPRAIASMPPGDWKEIVLKGGYLVIKPRDVAAKPLVWAHVPPKGNQGPKPQAWRSADELAADQRKQVGITLQRDAGMPKSGTPTKDEKPFGSAVGQERVRFKGDPAGRVETQTTGQAPGGATGPGGLPTKAAIAATEQADQNVSIPDWETLDQATLEKALSLAIKKFGEKHTITKDIKNALVSRNSGTPPSKPVKTPLPQRYQRSDVRDVMRAYETGDVKLGRMLLAGLPDNIRYGFGKYLRNLEFETSLEK